MSLRVKVKFPNSSKLKAALKSQLHSADFIQRIQAEVVESQILRLIRSGQSPVEGFGRYVQYKDREEYPGGRKPVTPVNLTLTGGLLKFYGVRKKNESSIEIGIMPDASKAVKDRALGNNIGTYDLKNVDPRSLENKGKKAKKKFDAEAKQSTKTSKRNQERIKSLREEVKRLRASMQGQPKETKMNIRRQITSRTNLIKSLTDERKSLSLRKTFARADAKGTKTNASQIVKGIRGIPARRFVPVGKELFTVSVIRKIKDLYARQFRSIVSKNKK